MKHPPPPTASVALRTPLLRGARRVGIALVGLPDAGRSTLFAAVSSTTVDSARLAGTRLAYQSCVVQVGLDEALVVDLPSLRSLRHVEREDLATLKFLLWGSERPGVSAHEPGGPPAPHPAPDVIVQVVDATALERHLELTLELLQLGRPLVLALNRMDEVRERGLHIGSRTLARALGVPVVPTAALRGQGLRELFAAAVEAARRGVCPLPLPPARHLRAPLEAIAQCLRAAAIRDAFRVPVRLLAEELAESDPFFTAELRQHFPDALAQVLPLRARADRTLPRPLREELHADRHHRAARLAEVTARPGGVAARRDWRYWADELFLNPRFGLAGSLAVFALVLFLVFELSPWIDGVTSAPLAAWVSGWQPTSTPGVIGRAVADGLVGLVGIVLPYMIPLVLLLVVLEQAGVMARIAFSLDRGFHRLGLHGNVAVPFLLGLGCNVPAITAIGAVTRGHERVIASLLVTFVPCSARSAIVLALAGKYLGPVGALAILLCALVVIAVLGRLVQRRYARGGPGRMEEIPAWSPPRWAAVLRETWVRSEDILTIVTPLLVGGSVVLALLAHFGADRAINLALTPVTSWWLGLPVALGVPILFGVLRKELSLLMVYQALGSFEVDRFLDPVQLTTFLLFLTFYVPCVSTFAAMMRTIGWRDAAYSLSLSVGVALSVGAIWRLAAGTAGILLPGGL